ncbi:MAG: hypothetical protein ACD_60C00138G0004 [uncultured bacterium]|nr:MAG: hypothetical protein ACD_60C00138G0004 [uncultured bacterium]
MNYRHIYHAGNFADVFKHIVLIALIQSFLKKETPFCYLETHAGIGCYDLYDAAAQKSKEFETGVKKIFEKENTLPLIQEYLTCIKKLNKTGELRYYPGSPYFAKQFLRTNDRMVLSELHPEDANTLKKFFKNDRNISIHHENGYQSLKAFLPPKERRGLILIDPPYEKPDELLDIPNILAEALNRFETGVYAVWYPIKNHFALNRFYQALKTKITRPQLRVEFFIHKEDSVISLKGCGMIILNPPWQLAESLKEILPVLCDTLAVDQGRFNLVLLW